MIICFEKIIIKSAWLFNAEILLAKAVSVWCFLHTLCLVCLVLSCVALTITLRMVIHFVKNYNMAAYLWSWGREALFIFCYWDPSRIQTIPKHMFCMCVSCVSCVCVCFYVCATSIRRLRMTFYLLVKNLHNTESSGCSNNTAPERIQSVGELERGNS